VRMTSTLAGVVLLVALVGCADETQTTYGPTAAGPTRTTSRGTGPGPAEAPSTPAADATSPKVVPTGAAVCSLYTTAQIAARLGRPIGTGVPFKDGPYVGCAWRAGKSGDAQVKGGRVIPTVVTITRAEAKHYQAYRGKTIALAKSRKAGGEQVMRGVGDDAFAIGASVKGVPIWYASTRKGDWLTGVEMSGAGSKAGIVAVTDLLLDILNRGG
jgi:hypothetical protein